ncbi:prolyl endopeptidase [Paraphoma chrysanthemicola]|uniref:Prolyl endopeptidase n=1 Tax=Paraphoma chrysanthemicola TaxID=798071 RepID=A0A8K0VV65_9PLEO|nr:prolyl endopeptidase [Paraphoma chrysanthemicola]
MSTPTPILTAHLRIARPTPSIPSLLPFYTTGLGFNVVSSFTAHNGFDGAMLGHPSLPYHLEFTAREGHESEGRAPTEDNLLVFYLPLKEEWEMMVRRMESVCDEKLCKSVKSVNPWWEQEGRGRTFEDADGWRVVLWNGAWEKAPGLA